MRASEHPRVAAAVGPGTAWSEVHHLDEVTSTHDVALAHLQAGEVPGFVLVADHQTHGRGRAGRGWEDGPSPDASLMLTATVGAPAGPVTLIPLAAGLAVIDALNALGVSQGRDAPGVPDGQDSPGGARLELKWPNDVLAGGRKCVGILLERHAVADESGAAIHDVVLVGIGIDVDWRDVERDGDREAWTSLAEVLEADIDRFALLGELLDALAARLAAVADVSAELLDDYRERCVTLGQEVEAQGAGGSWITGHAVDVDDHGRLLVDTGRERIAVTAGDVTHLRPM